jgi:uncharacterized protein
VVEVGGLLVAGVEGSARYRPGPHQYSELGMHRHVLALVPQLLLRRWRRGRAADVLLTHAPPEGPHAGSDYAHRGVGAFNASIGAGGRSSTSTGTSTCRAPTRRAPT